MGTGEKEESPTTKEEDGEGKEKEEEKEEDKESASDPDGDGTEEVPPVRSDGENKHVQRRDLLRMPNHNVPRHPLDPQNDPSLQPWPPSTDKKTGGK